MMYVFNTWLLANLLHPVIMFFYFGDPQDGYGLIDFSGIFNFLGLSLVLSVPSLLLSLLIGPLIIKSRLDPAGKFIFWLLVGPLIAVLNYMFLTLLLTGGLFVLETIVLVVPGMLSVVIIVLVRYRYFFKAELYYQRKNETKLILDEKG